MLKKTITYTDFDDKQVTETLHFNLTKTELLDAAGIKAEFEEVERKISGVERELEIPEIQMILNVVKKLTQLSYGVRSDDGKRFIKTEQTWVEFTQSPAYDAFLMGLFQNPKEAIAFMTGIMPADIREETLRKVNLTDLQQGIVEKLTATGPEAVPIALPPEPKEETIEQLRARIAQMESQSSGGGS